MESCRYCGQVLMDGLCRCAGAQVERERETHIKDACAAVDELWSVDDVVGTAIPLREETTMAFREILKAAVALISHDLLEEVGVSVPGVKGKAKAGKEGAIEVTRTDKVSRKR